MGPPSRSFAADAHDCIVVAILLTGRPNTSWWRASRAHDGELPSVSSQLNTELPKKDTPRSSKPAAVLVTVKGKSLRDGAFGRP